MIFYLTIVPAQELFALQTEACNETVKKIACAYRGNNKNIKLLLNSDKLLSQIVWLNFAAEHLTFPLEVKGPTNPILPTLIALLGLKQSPFLVLLKIFLAGGARNGL